MGPVSECARLTDPPCSQGNAWYSVSVLEVTLSFAFEASLIPLFLYPSRYSLSPARCVHARSSSLHCMAAALSYIPSHLDSCGLSLFSPQYYFLARVHSAATATGSFIDDSSSGTSFARDRWLPSIASCGQQGPAYSGSSLLRSCNPYPVSHSPLGPPRGLRHVSERPTLPRTPGPLHSQLLLFGMPALSSFPSPAYIFCLPFSLKVGVTPGEALPEQPPFQ